MTYSVIPFAQVNHTPRCGLTIEDLAVGFRYATAEPHRKDRANLLRFMRVSVATMARPDTAYDVSTAPERAQWDSARRVLSLSPQGPAPDQEIPRHRRRAASVRGAP